MANIIKKISGVDLSGNTVIADAAVTNMYTDESGDLNIKTSTELGDTEDSKVVITSKEINLNADTVKINDASLNISEIADNFDKLSDFARDVEYAVTNHSERIDDVETSVSTLQEDVTALTEDLNNFFDNGIELTEYMEVGSTLPAIGSVTYKYKGTVVNTFISCNISVSDNVDTFLIFKVYDGFQISYIIYTAKIDQPSENTVEYKYLTTVTKSSLTDDDDMIKTILNNTFGLEWDEVNTLQNRISSIESRLTALES